MKILLIPKKNMNKKINFLITPLVCCITYIISNGISDTFTSGWIGGGTAFFLMNLVERYLNKKKELNKKKDLNHKLEDKQ